MSVLRHYFLSGKADGGDASQVQPSWWNAFHYFQGGTAGDVMTRAPTDPHGATWTRPGAGQFFNLTLPGGYYANYDPGITGPATLMISVDGVTEFLSILPTVGVYPGLILTVAVYRPAATGRVVFHHLQGGAGMFALPTSVITLDENYESASFVHIGPHWLLTSQTRGASGLVTIADDVPPARG